MKLWPQAAGAALAVMVVSLAAGCRGEGQEPADPLDVAKTGAQAGDEQEDNGSFHPEMITVDPEVVEPGGEVEVRFPQGTNRAMVYHLERGREVVGTTQSGSSIPSSATATTTGMGRITCTSMTSRDDLMGTHRGAARMSW